MNLMSLSARRAWIEIAGQAHHTLVPPVALRKESVDRNTVDEVQTDEEQVALRKESVDRNADTQIPTHGAELSLSARRAWIEISSGKCR